VEPSEAGAAAKAPGQGRLVRQGVGAALHTLAVAVAWQWRCHWQCGAWGLRECSPLSLWIFAKMCTETNIIIEGKISSWCTLRQAAAPRC
jgi:hypothetical protein